MMSESPNEFESLRRLLVIKRHEVPPPGYFNGFSGKVIARIEAEALAAQLTWWQRLWVQLDLKPVVACAYGVGLGGLLFVGFGFVNAVDQERSVAETAPGSLLPTVASVPVLPSRVDLASERLLRADIPSAPSSVDPVLSSEAPVGLFSTPSLRAQPAGYFPSRN